MQLDAHLRDTGKSSNRATHVTMTKQVSAPSTPYCNGCITPEGGLTKDAFKGQHPRSKHS